MKIPLCKPSINNNEINLVKEVLESGWLAHGPKAKEFEENFASYIGSKYAISLNSCTSALQLALQAKNITGEVIVPSFTFNASANSVITAGSKLVLVDVDYDTCNIDIEKIKGAISKKTQAIMPVHYAGQSCEMKEIMEIASDKDLVVIEDSAECIGGEYAGAKTGTFGIGCFSFYPTKNITTGEGGMITTDDEELAAVINTLKAHGVSSSTFDRERVVRPWIRDAIMAGYNYRMCDVLAAIGVEQLKKIDDLNGKRIKNSQYLTKCTREIPNILAPVQSENCKHVYQTYTIKVDNIDRNKFIMDLRSKGVGASVHFDPPVHLQTYYMKMGYKKGQFPVTEKIADSIVSLPMYPELSREELDYIAKSVEEVSKSTNKTS